jgi:CheY-like chemotaxis protein
MLHQYRGKSHSTKLKIIAMSADFNKALIVEVLAAGFDGFLAKPLSLMNFRNLKLTPSLTRVMS